MIRVLLEHVDGRAPLGVDRRRRHILRAILLLAVAAITTPVAAAEPARNTLDWQTLPPLPDSRPLEGAFVGVAGGALVIAGGTDVDIGAGSDGREGTTLYQDVYVLEPGADTWVSDIGAIPPLAFGASVSTPLGLLCIGGVDPGGASATVLLLQRVDGAIVVARLPDLPESRVGAAASRVGDTIHVTGGLVDINTGVFGKACWTLKLSKDKDQSINPDTIAWEPAEPFPGALRWRSAGAAQQKKYFVFGGVAVAGNDSSSPQLSSAYTFEANKGWNRVADVPGSAAGASAAVAYGDSHVLLFTGRIGAADRNTPGGEGGGVLSYHAITDTWVTMESMPVDRAPWGAVNWGDGVVIGGTSESPGATRIHQVEIERQPITFGLTNLAVLSVYLAVLIVMGFYFSRRETSTEDFFLGGRRVPWWAAGLSIFGTQLSSISFMAIPAKVYATDWLYFATVFCIVATMPIVVYFYLPFYRRLNVTSAYEYLERRFNVAARLFGSISFVLFQCGRMTIVLFLPSLALSAVTGLNIYLCITVTVVLATLYTVLGGIEAVVWTDVLQVIVLMGAALLSLVIIILRTDGGLGRIFEVGAADDKFRFVDLGWDYTMPVLWLIVVGNLFSNMMSYSADQAVVQRYLVTPDEKSAARAIWMNAAVALPFAAIWYILGTCLYVFYKNTPQWLDPTLKTDQIFPLFIAQQLPVGVVGLVIAGLFAASMSTIDSSLNSISSVVVTDFYRRFRSTVNERTGLVVARWTTVLFGGVAAGTAMWMASYRDQIQSLWDLYAIVLNLLMGSLTGLFALGIFSRRASGGGALVGALAGAVILYFVRTYTDMHFFLYAVVGIVSCFVIGYLASLLLPARTEPEGLTIYTLRE